MKIEMNLMMKYPSSDKFSSFLFSRFITGQFTLAHTCLYWWIDYFYFRAILVKIRGTRQCWWNGVKNSKLTHIYLELITNTFIFAPQKLNRHIKSKWKFGKFQTWKIFSLFQIFTKGFPVNILSTEQEKISIWLEHT